MEITKATDAQFQIVRHIIKSTIETVYPNYYPSGAVEFFLHYHSDETIREAIEKGSVYLLQVDGRFVGTGSLFGFEIGRLFVLSEHQGKGYGTALMDALEKTVFRSYPEITLDASLPAYELYVHRGYTPLAFHTLKLENGHYLCYHVMSKRRDSGEAPLTIH